MNVHVRLERPEDQQAVHDVVERAFERPDEADLVDALREDSAWIEGLSWVAERDGTIVGHALATRNHVGGVPSLCLAPCSVVPEEQRTGAGTAVIEAVIAAAREQGEKFMTVLGHTSYYPRFGFRVVEGAFMVMELADEPMPTGEVQYAKAFGV